MLAGLGQAVVLRNMRCDVHLAQRRNVIVGVVGFVLADRDSSSRSFGFLLEHRLGGTPLGGAAGLRDGASATKTFSTRCATPSWRRTGSRTSGAIREPFPRNVYDASFNDRGVNVIVTG